MIKVLGYAKEVGICEYPDQTAGVKVKAELTRGEPAVMDFSLVSQQIKWLMGEVLTVVEATMTNDRQLKATKDIIKDKFSAKLNWIFELCGMPQSQDEGLLDPNEE